MGRDFWYYLDPPSKTKDDDGYYCRDCEQHTLDFNVSRHNDVLGYLDPDYPWSEEQILDRIKELGKELMEAVDDYQNFPRAVTKIAEISEAIAVFTAIFKVMDDEVWLHYN